MGNKPFDEKSIFPHPDQADENGLLCAGGNLSLPVLLDSYSHGIFPWPHEGYPLLWFSPPERGIIYFDNVHISKRLARFRKSWKGHFLIDKNFPEVVQYCADTGRKGQRGTWIIPEMIDAYVEFHMAGYSHCIEAWEDDELVGGIYGVFVGNVFSAESMFFKKSNCSKLCLWYLIEHLESIGLQWLDVQVLTPITEQFGGIYIPRDKFFEQIKTQQQKELISFIKK